MESMGVLEILAIGGLGILFIPIWVGSGYISGSKDNPPTNLADQATLQENCPQACQQLDHIRQQRIILEEQVQNAANRINNLKAEVGRLFNRVVAR